MHGRLNVDDHVGRQATEGAFGGVHGTSEAMRRVHRLAQQAAAARSTVLITGESGTGKSALARAIHQASARARAPFVSVHCAGLASSLIESELFGHERGAFTGADRTRQGRVECADKGTLFLDEVGDIDAAVQVKLLSVLQERTFERVGGTDRISVDVRLIAATNRDLAADVRARRFREDLFYRLNVIHIDMPPLRDRAGDAMLLATRHAVRICTQNKRPFLGFTESARRRISSHDWPGNVRELENAIERAVILAGDRPIEPTHLAIEPSRTPPAIPGATLALIERYAILATLDAAEGSTARAAAILGVSVRTVQYRLQEYLADRSVRSGSA